MPRNTPLPIQTTPIRVVVLTTREGVAPSAMRIPISRRLWLYQERHDAVGADGAQSQAQETDDAGDPGQGAVREKSEADALFERLQVVDDEVRLDRRDPLTNENCRCPRAERRFETKKVDRVEARYRSSCLRSRSVAARRHQTCSPSAA